MAQPQPRPVWSRDQTTKLLLEILLHKPHLADHGKSAEKWDTVANSLMSSGAINCTGSQLQGKYNADKRKVRQNDYVKRTIIKR
jgi:hypothetical protein